MSELDEAASHLNSNTIGEEPRKYTEKELESECYKHGCPKCFPELTGKDGNI